jgi:Fe2+ transport system protein FeoA
LPDDAAATIEHNPDVKSREMGLFPGAVVRMLRNRAGERALVIAVGDARLLLARRIAQRIRLQ